MTRLELLHPRDDAVGGRRHLAGQEMPERGPVQPPLDVGKRQERLQLGAEIEPSADLGVVERLDPEAVAGDQELPLLRIPQREGEHAPQLVDAVRPALLVDCLLYTSDAADERSSVDL